MYTEHIFALILDASKRIQEAIQITFVECAKNIVNVLEKRKEEKDIEER